jgi:hypothetical protein
LFSLFVCLLFVFLRCLLQVLSAAPLAVLLESGCFKFDCSASAGVVGE